MAAPPFICSAGGAGRVFWVHNCFCSSGAWRFVAASVANAVELSAGIAGATVRGLVFDSAGTDNDHGFDAAGHDRGPTVTKDGVWPCDWFSLWIEHAGRDGWGRAWRSLSDSRIWIVRDEFGSGLCALHCCGSCRVSGEIWSAARHGRF